MKHQNTKLKFIDKGQGLYSFENKGIWVCCPHCSTPALLHVKHNPLWRSKHHVIFTCHRCGLKLDNMQQDIWYGHYYIYLNKQCPRCGAGTFKYSREFSQLKDVPKHIHWKCNICHQMQVFTEIYPKPTHFDQNISKDPHIGLDLYLKVSTRFGELWAYNIENIIYIKQFVKAELRECRSSWVHHAYTNRLPTWIKSARNRKEILKALLRLEQMATTIQP